MSVNKSIIAGHVGKDPEITNFDNGTSVANFSIATTEKGYKTKEGKEVPERTEWHNIVVWGGLVKVVQNWVKKGSQLYIEGKLRTRSWDDQNGVRKYITEIYVDNLQLLGSKPKG